MADVHCVHWSIVQVGRYMAKGIFDLSEMKVSPSNSDEVTPSNLVGVFMYLSNTGCSCSITFSFED